MVRELPPERAAETCASAAQLLITAMTGRRAKTISSIGGRHRRLTERQTPARADYVCGAAIKILTPAMTRTTNPFALERLTDSFVALCAPNSERAARVLKVLTDVTIKTTAGLGLSAWTTSVREVATN